MAILERSPPLKLTDLNDDVCSIISSFLSLSDCLHVLECSRGMRELSDGLLRRRRNLRLAEELGSDGDAVSLLSLLTSSSDLHTDSEKEKKEKSFQLLDALPLKNLDFSDRRDGSVSMFKGFKPGARQGSTIGGPDRPHQQLWERKSDLPPLLLDSFQMVQAIVSLDSFCKLKELDLRGCTLSHMALAQLLTTPLSSLEILDLRGATSRKKFRATPAFATTLKILRCGVLCRTWSFEAFTSLEEGHFDGSLKAREIEELSSLPKFSRLVLKRARACEMRFVEGFKTLFGKLTHLTFDECDITPRSHLGQPPFAVLCDLLEASSLLESLSLLETPDPNVLRGPSLNEDLLREVFARARLPNLHSLCFCPAPKVGDASVKILVNATQGRLKSLRIFPGKASAPQAFRQQGNDPFFFGDDIGMMAQEVCSISDLSLDHLSESCPNLEILEIPHSSISDRGLQRLALSPCAKKLQVLNLSRTPLFEQYSLDLISQRCVRLGSIMLRGCHVLCGNGEALTSILEKGVKVSYTPPVVVKKTINVFSSAPTRRNRSEDAVKSESNGEIILDDTDDDDDSTKEKNISCPLCREKVSLKSLLPKHFNDSCREYLVQCTLCEQAPPMRRSELQTHRQAHADRREDLAKRSRCPFFLDGCRFIELSISEKLQAVQKVKDLALMSSLDGVNRDVDILRWRTRTLGVGEHLSQGHCTKAMFTCASCGRDCGRAPLTTCALEDCASVARIRARLQNKYPLATEASDLDMDGSRYDSEKRAYRDVVQYRDAVELKGEADGTFSIPNPIFMMARRTEVRRNDPQAAPPRQTRLRHYPRGATRFKTILSLQTTANGIKVWRWSQEQLEEDDD